MVARYPMQGTYPIPGPLDMSPYRSTVSHANEVGAPGYYSASLNSSSTLAEVVSSGLRSGLHRYTCAAGPASQPCVLHMDACHRNHGNDCGPGSLRLEASSNGTALTLSASLTENGSFGQDCGGVPIYIAAEITAFNGPQALAATGLGRWADNARLAGQGAANSTGKSGSLGAWVAWAAPATILVRIAVSYVSVAGALQNLAAEQQQQGGGGGGTF